MERAYTSVEEALRIIYERLKLKPIGIEEILIKEAYGRILAEDLRSSIDVPFFDKAKVDGYVVKAEDTFGAEESFPKKLKIKGKVKIGEEPKIKVQSKECVEISTGCSLPKGADAVVMYEHTHREGNSILVYRSVAPYENVIKKGFDVKLKELIAKKFCKLTMKEIGMIASIGLRTVKVLKRPKVSFFSIGDELIELGQPISKAKVYDINSNVLQACILQHECIPVFLGIVKDQKDDIERMLNRALKVGDVVITTGSVSIGALDLLPSILKQKKPGILISGIRCHPGKPTMIALSGRKLIFALPGRPTSALISFYLLVSPILSKMAGIDFKIPILKAKITKRILSKFGQRTFVPVKLEKRMKEYLAHPLLLESEAITTFSKADGFAEIEERREFVEEGEKVNVWLFGKGIS